MRTLHYFSYFVGGISGSMDVTDRTAAWRCRDYSGLLHVNGIIDRIVAEEIDVLI